MPEKYRIPIVLCYFEGLTHDEAASRLGWPIGTVKGRLARARDLLRRRLTARGVTLSATALASHLAFAEAKAVVPESLRIATLKAAWAVACRAGVKMTVASGVSGSVASLVEGVIQSMRLTQVGTVTLPLLLVAGAIAAGVVVGAPQLANDPPGGQTAPKPASGGAAATQVKGSVSSKQASAATANGVAGSAPKRNTGSSSNGANSVPSRRPSTVLLWAGVLWLTHRSLAAWERAACAEAG